MHDAFKALADPTRREILDRLQSGPLTAGAIAEAFDISKPSISHHLKILREAMLVEAHREGQRIIYSLNLTVFQELMKWSMGFLGEQND